MTQFTHIPYFGKYGYVPPVAAVSVSGVPWKVVAILAFLFFAILTAFWFASRNEVKMQQSETAKANDRADLAEQANKPRRLL